VLFLPLTLFLSSPHHSNQPTLFFTISLFPESPKLPPSEFLLLALLYLMTSFKLLITRYPFQSSEFRCLTNSGFLSNFDFSFSFSAKPLLVLPFYVLIWLLFSLSLFFFSQGSDCSWCFFGDWSAF